jgi:hypothetical protein
LGYFDYHTSRSTDGGSTWTHPEPIVGAGSCSPNLVRIGGSLILGGGRMCGNATSGVFLWLDEDGMGDAAAFEPGSNRWGVQGAHLNPLGLFLEPPGPLLTHLHTVDMAYSECLPTRLNPPG